MAEHRMHRIASVFVLLLAFSTPTLIYAVPPATVVETFQKARQLVETDPVQAWELAQQIPKIPEAEDVRLELLVDASLKSLHIEEAIKTIEELEGVLKDKSAIFERRLERAELLAMLGKTDEAKKLVSTLQRQRSDVSGRGGERRFIFSRLHRLQHDLAEATNNDKEARRLAVEMLISFPAEIATKREGLAATPDDLSQNQRLLRARNLNDSWDYHAARVEYERLKNVAAHREEALWNLGLIGLRKLRDRPAEAEKIFKELSAPGGRYAEDSLFFLARAYMVQERYDDARKTYAEYSKRYPRGKESMLVDYYKGWLYYDHRENEKAIAGFDEFIEKYGRRSSRSSYIYGFRAWAFMRMNQWQKAIDAWDTLIPFGNPLVEGKAYYWQAYAYKQLGQNDKAISRIDRLRQRWPLTYYGMLGEQLRAEIEGKDARASRVWWPEGGGNTDDSPRVDVEKFNSSGLSAAEKQQWERVKTLSALNERHKAREGFGPLEKRILSQVPAKEKDAWIHALGLLVGDYNDMYTTAWNSITGYPGMIESGTLRAAMSYPRAYRRIVEDVAAEFDLYPGFIWSIMRQESRYKPGAVSGTDAIGALQMIPQTARKVAQDLGTVFNIATFFRPEVGFRFSGYYMRKILDTFGGLWVPTASSYNTGPGPIARWFKKNPDVSFAWLIEEFEYNEGRAYGRKVAEHMVRYLYLYESDPEVRAQVLDNLFPLSRDIEIPDDVGY